MYHLHYSAHNNDDDDDDDEEEEEEDDCVEPSTPALFLELSCPIFQMVPRKCRAFLL